MAISVPLGCYVSVFQAEVYAIMSALEECASLPQRAKICICSDSRAAIAALSSSSVKSSLVADCRSLFADMRGRYSIELIWVPGHSGVHGNEKADALARAASATIPVGPEPILPIGPSRLKQKLETAFRQKFIRYWREAEINEYPKQLVSNPNKKYGLHYLTADRKTIRAVTALLTGHGPFRRHLARMFVIQDTNCRFCELEDETAEHILCYCPCFWRERLEAFGSTFLDVSEVSNVELQSVLKFTLKTKLHEHLVCPA